MRDSKLTLRVTKHEKERIKRAAILSESSTATFVRNTILAASKRAIRMDGVLELTGEGAATFVDTMTNPQEPNEKPRALARRAEVPGQAKV